ncbi:hypothetical protein Poli38472_012321 [Pythium oligandrum]|uniref:Apple domain-containing protein n=1 Tax=Pythium oligandrum TaxID=41045 RepID=A0A8K1CR46_PYTOL|nr:hypothetical protein Poli38472_012321 [Pythium oligandrum]|eukprot:TMW67205.1 hypothetical protein Poli38472_012321 [Pythium oligandrum]
MVQISSVLLLVSLAGLVDAGNYTCSLAFPGVDFAGNDIGNVKASSAKECCSKCTEFKGCRAFSWNNYEGGTCWLKSSDNFATVTQGVQSGTVTQQTDDGLCTMEADLDYTGNDLANAPSPNAGDCCSKCEARDGCSAYTWTPWNGGMCWMKTSGNYMGLKEYKGAYAGLVHGKGTNQ